MTISELEKELASIKEVHGDIKVFCQTLTHKWPPEPEVRVDGTKFLDKAYVLLNP